MFDPTTSTISPPRPLGNLGLSLWNSIQGEFRIDDSAGRELLALACEQLDRVARLSERIEAEGELITTQRGDVKVHPGVREELAGRAFISKTLQALGLNLEPLRAVGRPPSAQKQREQKEARDGDE